MNTQAGKKDGALSGALDDDQESLACEASAGSEPGPEPTEVSHAGVPTTPGGVNRSTPWAKGPDGPAASPSNSDEPDMAEANRFIRALTRHDQPGDCRTFQTFDDDEDRKSGTLAGFFHGGRHAATLKKRNAQGAGVFLTVNATDGQGREKHNVKRVRAVFVDADKNGADVLKKIEAEGLPLHIINESSPGKFHGYWLVRDFPLDKFTPVQKALIQKFDTDPPINDLPRVMRLPGFFHQKDPANRFRTRIVSISDHAPYSLEQIVDTLGLSFGAAPAPAAKKPSVAPDADGAITKGGRNTFLSGEAFRLKKKGLDVAAIESTLLVLNMAACTPPLSDDEVRAIARGKRGIEPDVNAQQGYDKLVDRSDTGNANLLTQQTAGNLRYVPEKNRWIFWDDTKWIEDTHGAIAQGEALRVAETYQQKARDLARQAADTTLDEGERKRIAAAASSLEKWATHCRNKRTIEAMLAVASRFTAIQLPLDKLNRDPNLLGVQNGVVDLRTGELRPAAREDHVTKRCSVAFNPQAQASRWVRHIDEVTGVSLPVKRDSAGVIDPASVGLFKKRPDLAHYVQLAFGYLLTGLTCEHKIFLLTGDGSNGKNVTSDEFQRVAGDYAVSIAPDALMATRGQRDAERPTPTMARLAGARAAISSESHDGQQLDVAMVKRHTGDGFMTARGMHENTFQFEITHKLVLMTNHTPKLDHLDEAMRGRVHIIPFERRWNRPGHPDRNPELPDGDKNLSELLKAEAEGILAWLVAGAVAYSKEGLEPPAEVAHKTRAYFEEQDTLGRWLALYEQCDPKDGQGATDLFQKFQGWCISEAAGSPGTQTGFSKELKRRGFAKKEGKSGNLWGLRLRDAGADEEDLF